MPRIELNSRYYIKDQTSKPPFINAKEPLLTSLKINVLLFTDLTETGVRTKHSTVQDPYNGKHVI